MGAIFSVVNQKGGVGKTTTSINLGAYLAQMGQRVLLIDIDPQANATSGVGVDVEKLTGSLYELFTKEKNILDVLYPTSIENLHLIPGSPNLSGVSVEFMNTEGRELILKDILSTVKDSYDFILIDCPPSLELLTVNALVASNKVIIPVQCEYYALEGLSRLMNVLEIIKQKVNPALEIEGIVLTMYDKRTTLNKEVVKETQKFFEGKVYEAIVPRNVRVSEAPSYGQPISIYAENSPGAKAYRDLAKEVMKSVHN